MSEETNEVIEAPIEVQEKPTPAPKMVPLSEVIAEREKRKAAQSKLDQILAEQEEKANANLSENEKIIKALKKVEQERDLFKSERDSLKIEKDKHSSWLRAKSQLGDGYGFENEDEAYNGWLSWNYNPESVDDDAIRYLNLVKRPKKVDSHQVIDLGAKSLLNKPVTELSVAELNELAEVNPAEYERVRAERLAIKRKRK